MMRILQLPRRLGGPSNSEKLTTDHIVMTAVVSLSVFFLLLLSEVSLRVSIISSLFLVFQIFAGGTILRIVSKRNLITWQEFCGVGIALGSLLTLILDQVFRKTPISEIAWAIPIILILFQGSKVRKLQNLSLSLTRTRCADFCIIFGTIFLILTPEWFWTFPFAIFLIITSLQVNKAISKKWLIPLSLIAFLTSIFSLLKRPIGWWIEDSDFALYEAISKTLSIWGFRDNINAAGTSTNYHWFAYAWSGLNDRLSGAPAWVSNTRIIPVMTIVGLVLIVWSLLERLSFSRQVIIGSLLIVGSFDTIQTWGRGFKIGIIASPSQIYGTLLLFTFLYLFVLFNAKELKLFLPLFFVLAFSIVGAKVAHGVILAGALGAVWLFQFVRTKALFTPHSLHLVLILAAIYTSFYFIIGGGGGSSRGMLLDQVAFVDGISGDFRAYGLVIHWLAALIFLFGMYGFQLFGLLAIFYFYSSEQIDLKFFAAGTAATGLLSAAFLSGEFAVELFFTHAASSILLILIAPTLIQEILNRHVYLGKKYLITIILCGLFAAVVATSLPNLNSGSLKAIVLRTLPSLAGFLPILCAFILMLNIKKRKLTILRLKPFIVLALTGMMSLSVGFYSINFLKNIRTEYPSFERNYLDRTGGDLPDLIDASKWINTNVAKDAIFATNDFCREISETCNSNTDWGALLNFSMKCTTDEVLRSDKCNAGGYPLLTAIVDRRLLAGNYYVGISDGSAIKPWVVERVLDSVAFAKTPSNQTHQKLVSQDVSWFLLRKDLTNQTNWTKFGETKFSNRHYLIIKLMKD